jgi:hypothetical protein
MPADSELAQHEDYVESIKWKFATTYAEKSPHWYTVSDWNPDKRDQFEQLVSYIRKYGYNRPYFGHPFICLDIGDNYYWAMGDPTAETDLINRAVISGAPAYK